jgi:5-methylcytosine-specific restriction endonuclease McrA
VLAHQKEYRERNREQIAERRGARRRENIEDALAREQARRDAERVTHGDKIRAYYREYQQKNREKRRAYEVARYPKNRDKNRERTARWHAENPEKSAALRARRRAWVAGAAIKDFTAEQWQTCKEYFQGHCAYCGKPFDALTQDHVVPLSRGGNHTAANIVPACQSCNSRKNDRTLMEYLMLG